MVPCPDAASPSVPQSARAIAGTKVHRLVGTPIWDMAPVGCTTGLQGSHYANLRRGHFWRVRGPGEISASGGRLPHACKIVPIE
jgi:hypothetical protein